jgi:hypothetical protein
LLAFKKNHSSNNFALGETLFSTKSCGQLLPLIVCVQPRPFAYFVNEFNACENLGQGHDNIVILYPQQTQLSTSSCFLFCLFVC